MKKHILKALYLILVLLLVFVNIFAVSAIIIKVPIDGGFDIFDGEISDQSTVTVTYECCDSCGYKEEFIYTKKQKITVPYNIYCTGETAFVGWVSESGEEYYGGETLPFADVTLKAKRVPLLLGNDEVLSFANSDRYFHTEEFDGYYMNSEDYKMMKRNANRVFGAISPVTLMLNAVFSTYSGWEWMGSCYGMSTLAFLQHYGVTDVLGDRDEACIADLPNSAEVASKINYYQWSAAGSFLCENFSRKKDSKMYSQQLKDMFESVSNGNIVLFTYYSENIFKGSGHTVLLTGAYTQADGTKVLLCYDCNYPDDYRKETFNQRFYISEDFTTIKRGYSYPVGYSIYELGSFNWTDDYEHFEPFDINGGGKVRVWYSHFFSQLTKLMSTTFKLTFGI
jgi:hypothetical protein